MDINPSSEVQYTSIFSHQIGCLFTLLMVSLAMQKRFSLLQLHLLILILLLCFRCYLQKIITKTYFKDLHSYVYILVFNLFQVNVCDQYTISVQFHSFTYKYPVILAPFIEKTIIPLLTILDSLIEYLLTIDSQVYSWAWSISLTLFQYITVLMAIALQYSLKSGRALLFLRISLAVWRLLWFHIHFRSDFSTSFKKKKKTHWNLEMACPESVDGVC